MKPKIDAIQSLRGIAILYIVLFHIGNVFKYEIFSHGASGNSIFFIISGFTLSYPYVQHNVNGISEAISFVKKRIARIYFPYFLPFLVMLLLLLLTGKGDQSTRDLVNIVRNLFLFHLPSQSIHPYSWFLVYTIYFYFTFCVVVLIFRLNIFLYSALMVLPYLIFSFLGGLETIDAIPFSFANLFYVSGILLGIFFDRVRGQFRNWPAIIMLLIFFLFPFFVSNGYLFAGSAVLLVWVYSRSTLSFGWLNKIGDASYSIYLIHAIVLSVLKSVVIWRNPLVFIIFLAICLSVGYLYYLYCEKPLTRFAYNLLGLKKTSRLQDASSVSAG